MKRKKLLVLLPIVIVAVIIVSGVAIPGTTYTWEKTFEVTKPEIEIECEIEISDCKVVGCPVRIWVKMKLEDECGKCWHECKEECWHKCKEECCCQINGTYSVDLYWWNETQILPDWQHLMYLQEETNITLTCWKHIETYTFIPEMEGAYKVVVTFATETETLTFSSED